MSGRQFAMVVALSLLGLALALLWLPALSLVEGAAEGLAGQAGATPDGVLTVCPAGPPDCDYVVIQDAVDAAADGDIIKVATGVYTGVNDYDGLAQVVYISKTITLRGGYTAPGFSEPPDPVANPTTLDAQGQGRVIYITGNISPTVEGLCITGGNATPLGGRGGGVYINSSQVTLSSNKVQGNTASYGGGLYLWSGSAMLIGNTVSDNAASNYGGGLYLRSSDAAVDSNDISGNTAGFSGGGLYLYSSPATLSGNTISDNTASNSYGGGLYLDGSSALLDTNTISGNFANLSGGGVSLSGSDAVISGNTIISNTAGFGCAGGCFGGGLHLDQSNATIIENVVSGNVLLDPLGWGAGAGLWFSDATLDGNLISGNWGNWVGGGLSLYQSDAALGENRIVSNTARYGGGLYAEHSSPTLINTIVADNQASGAGSGLYLAGAGLVHLSHSTIARNTGGDGSGVYAGAMVWLTNTILVSHTVGIYVEGGDTATLEATLWGSGEWANNTDWAGPGTILTGTVNLWGDPAFVDPDAGDYHIGPGSAAIDSGIDAGVTTDIDGEPRPMGAGYDIGADEMFAGPALAVSKQAEPDPVQTGSPLTYTLRVTNTGTVSLTTTITDELPLHVTPGGSLVWTPPPLLPGEAWTETVLVTVEMGYVGPLTNGVRVSSEEGATGAYTNTATVTDVPVAGLVAANDSPTVLGNPTTLTATVIAGSHVSYTWAFGDGAPGSGAVVTHTYPAVGVYTAVVTASNPVSELTATTTVTITGPGFSIYLPVVMRTSPWPGSNSAD